MCKSLRSINPYHGPASTLHWFYPPQSLRCRTCPVLSPHLNHIQPLVSHQKILTRNLSAFPPNQQKPLSKVRQLSHAQCCLSSWFLSIYFSFITFTFIAKTFSLWHLRHYKLQTTNYKNLTLKIKFWYVMRLLPVVRMSGPLWAHWYKSSPCQSVVSSWGTLRQARHAQTTLSRPPARWGPPLERSRMFHLDIEEDLLPTLPVLRVSLSMSL